MKIAMLGTGAYGLALASKLAGNGHKVVMWTENKDKEKDFISSLIDSYCRFNLRKSIFFTEEGIEKYKKMGEFVKYVSNSTAFPVFAV